MIKILLCVDDTDDITKETSTGKVASLMAEEVVNLGGEIYLGITRHQLFLSDEIDYTSHNSSMCFEAYIEKDKVIELWDNCVIALENEMSDVSDPGICLCEMDKVTNIDKLISFGLIAKEEVVSKESAYKLAQECNVRLEEFGGKGIGVIGAIAGVGLRLFGNDGTFRGGKKLFGLENSTVLVRELKNELGIEEISTIDGHFLNEHEKVRVEEQIKLVYRNYKKIALVKKDGVYNWKICRKSELFNKDMLEITPEYHCNNFNFDNDIDECIDQKNTCCNCLYRRWTENGMDCCIVES